MPNQPFDLAKIDYDSIRKKKRRDMLKWSIAPVVIVFLVALWFILPTPLTHQAIGEYKKGGFEAARNWLTPLTVTSPEPFVIAFNSGTVDTKLGRYDIAEDELTRALVLAPKDKRCMVAQNLVVSLTAHIDAVKSDAKEVKILETKVQTVVTENQDCFKGSAAQGGASGSSDSDSDSLSESQQQQLEQKEQKGQERQEQFAQDEVYNPDNPSLKPW